MTDERTCLVVEGACLRCGVSYLLFGYPLDIHRAIGSDFSYWILSHWDFVNQAVEKWRKNHVTVDVRGLSRARCTCGALLRRSADWILPGEEPRGGMGLTIFEV